MKEKNKILFATDLKFSSNTGGVQTAVINLFEGLKQYSNEQNIIFLTLYKNNGNKKEVLVDGIRVILIEPCNTKYLKPKFYFNSRLVKKEIKKIKPDVVNVIDNPAMVLATANIKIPTVYTIHGIKSIEAKLWKGRDFLSHQAEGILEKYFLKKYKRFIAISPYVKNIIESKDYKNNVIYEVPNALSEKCLNYLI